MKILATVGLNRWGKGVSALPFVMVCCGMEMRHGMRWIDDAVLDIGLGKSSPVELGKTPSSLSCSSTHESSSVTYSRAET